MNQYDLAQAQHVLNVMLAMSASLVIVGVYLMWKRWPR